MSPTTFPASADNSLLLTGVTGFIGAALLPLLQSQGYHCWVLTRNPGKYRPAEGLVYFDDFARLPERLPPMAINLSGEGIADGRWSVSRKRVLLQSREGVTETLLDAYRQRGQRLSRVLSGSAVGVYGCQPSRQSWSENDLPPDQAGSLPAGEFGAELCQHWERAALAARDEGTEVCLLRIGPVLAAEGGMIARLRLPFMLGLGGPIGRGEQWLSWIHRDDLCRAIVFLLQARSLPLCANLVAPGAVTNLEFSQGLGRVWRRPAVVPLPPLVVSLVWGQMGRELLSGGQRVVPQVLQELGFEFLYPQLEDALRAL